MMDRDRDSEERLRFARYLARASAAVRIIGVLCGIGAVLMILVAQSMRKSDQVGFTLIGLAVLLIAALVWGTGVFQGTVARTVPLLVSIDVKLDWMGRFMSAQAAAAEAKQLGEQAVAPAAAPSVAPATASAPPPATTSAPPPATTSAPPPATASAPPPATTSAPPEPERSPCPHCGEPIHPQATLCVHCMKKVAR